MSANAKLIAAAQVNVTAGPPGTITFQSNTGFATASRGGPGAYVLTLSHHHDANKLVIGVTRNNTDSGQIAATPVGTGAVKDIQISCFDDTDTLADTPFFISVQSVHPHDDDDDDDDCDDDCDCDCDRDC
jgi:hypothetical protein